MNSNFAPQSHHKTPPILVFSGPSGVGKVNNFLLKSLIFFKKGDFIESFDERLQRSV